jgi:predicted ribonuclease YlaK
MKFLDTNALLSGKLPAEDFAISSITLKELENIKNSERKSDEVKYKARRALRDLDAVRHEVVTFQNKMLKPLKKLDLEINDDAKIVACAYYLNKPHFYSKRKDVEFVTGDRACRNIAQLVLKQVTPVEEVKEEEYFGYKEVMLTEAQMCDFYSNLGNNMFNLFVNEYVVIKDTFGNILDLYVWTGEEHKRIKTNAFFSNYFGETKPLKDDIYQKMACDSLIRNKLTVLRGPAGTGKSYLGLGYLFALLDNGKIDKIIVFCNTVATKGSAKLGFYPGTRDEKILDSQVGNLLASKLGDILAVEKLIAEDKLLLLPVSDIRGFDSTGMNCGIYIDEAQNSTVEMMKLMLQRIGEDSVCVICGDDFTQVDMVDYEGANNGLKRLCQVFKNEPYFGTAYLKNCHRSKIAQKAEEM